MSNPSSDSFRNVTKYTGQDYSFAPRYLRPRDPLAPTNASSDIKPKEQQGHYPLGSLWTNSANGNFWALANISNNLARWILLSNGSTGPLLNVPVPNGTSPVVPSTTGAVTFTSSDNSVTITGSTNSINFQTSTGATTTKLKGQDAVSVGPDGSGNITVKGNICANATHASPLFTINNGANTEQWDLQVATTSASSSINNAGISSFSNNDFSIDANGFVTLVEETFIGTATTVGAVTGSINYNIPTSSNQAISVIANIVGWANDSTGVGGQLVGLAKNVAGTVTILGTPDLVKNNSNTNSAWNATLVVSGTNINVQVLGIAAKTINWRAYINFVTAP